MGALCLRKPKKGENLIVSKKNWQRGTLLLWNVLFHVRGFGCVQIEILSTYAQQLNAQKSGPIATKN